MQSKFDIYLARVSSLVQIGLFAVALATIYYTVIPLYKTAQVEEALARKELEYQQLSKKVDDLYVRNRKWEVTSLAMRSIDCLGWDTVQREGGYDFSWAQDIAGCLDKKLADFGVGSLADKDVVLLGAKFKSVAKSVLASRESFKARYDSYEKDLLKDPSLAPKQHPMFDKLDSLERALGISKKELDDHKYKMDVMIGRSRIVEEFLVDSTDMVKSIKDIDWNSTRMRAE